MKNISDNAYTLLADGKFTPFVLVKIGTHCLTSYHRDISAKGDNFLADNRLLSISPPRQTSVAGSDEFNMVFAMDMDYYTFLEGLTGAPVKVYIGFVNDGTLAGLPLGPLFGDNDLMMGYAGNLDTVNRAYSGEDTTILVNCTAPLRDFDAVNLAYASSAWVKQYNPEDTSFDLIQEGTTMATIRWGKLTSTTTSSE